MMSFFFLQETNNMYLMTTRTLLNSPTICRKKNQMILLNYQVNVSYHMANVVKIFSRKPVEDNNLVTSEFAIFQLS